MANYNEVVFRVFIENEFLANETFHSEPFNSKKNLYNKNLVIFSLQPVPKMNRNRVSRSGLASWHQCTELTETISQLFATQTQNRTWENFYTRRKFSTRMIIPT